MKTLLLLTLSAALQAAPIFTCTGACTPVENGWFVDLKNYTPYEPLADRMATFTASEPINQATMFLDNAPHSPGSGFVVALDGQQVLNTGVGGLFQEWVTLFLPQSQAFSVIQFSTNQMVGWRERGLVLQLRGIVECDPTEEPPPSSVPEPGSWALMGLGLASIVGWRRG